MLQTLCLMFVHPVKGGRGSHNLDKVGQTRRSEDWDGSGVGGEERCISRDEASATPNSIALKKMKKGEDRESVSRRVRLRFGGVEMSYDEFGVLQMVCSILSRETGRWS